MNDPANLEFNFLVREIMQLKEERDNLNHSLEIGISTQQRLQDQLKEENTNKELWHAKCRELELELKNFKEAANSHSAELLQSASEIKGLKQKLQEALDSRDSHWRAARDLQERKVELEQQLTEAKKEQELDKKRKEILKRTLVHCYTLANSYADGTTRIYQFQERMLDVLSCPLDYPLEPKEVWCVLAKQQHGNKPTSKVAKQRTPLESIVVTILVEKITNALKNVTQGGSGEHALQALLEAIKE